VADAAALEALPGIGPALARRIVEDRALNGPFGSAEGLQRVRGVGVKLAARVAPHVTFSGMPRLSGAAVRRPP
jgi:competence protein ComEA